jgi:hypothetical protein
VIIYFSSLRKADIHTSIDWRMHHLPETVWSMVNAELVIGMKRIKRIDFA